jgi:TM2 domain-containing membrane protein YozV
MEKEFYQPKKSTKMMRLFWKAAGADRYILEKSTYGDQIKYVCLGGIIVATGVMAAIAGGYAFYTIFEPKGNALDSFNTASGIAGHYDQTDLATAIKASIFGLIWGAIIFNIDRFIVTSTGKGDGTEAITRKELVGAAPRLTIFQAGRDPDVQNGDRCGPARKADPAATTV